MAVRMSLCRPVVSSVAFRRVAIPVASLPRPIIVPVLVLLLIDSMLRPARVILIVGPSRAHVAGGRHWVGRDGRGRWLRCCSAVDPRAWEIRKLQPVQMTMRPVGIVALSVVKGKGDCKARLAGAEEQNDAMAAACEQCFCFAYISAAQARMGLKTWTHIVIRNEASFICERSSSGSRPKKSCPTAD